MANGQEIVRQTQDTMKDFTLPSSPGEAETATAAECNGTVIQSDLRLTDDTLTCSL